MEESDQPQTHTPQEILSADSIQNIDTARMALRWALERMHKLEQRRPPWPRSGSPEGYGSAAGRFLPL